jgi:Polyketide cyclase / dehydrase and lipid transport
LKYSSSDLCISDGRVPSPGPGGRSACGFSPAISSQEEPFGTTPDSSEGGKIQMARIEESIGINSPVEKVFAFTTDVGKWSTWQSIILEAEQTSPGPFQTGTTFRGTTRLMGRTMKWTARATEYEPPMKYGKDITSGSILIRQQNTYRPTPQGSEFTIVYNMKVGGLLRVVSPLLVRSMRTELKKSLGSLKQILEEGNKI